MEVLRDVEKARTSSAKSSVVVSCTPSKLPVCIVLSVVNSLDELGRGFVPVLFETDLQDKLDNFPVQSCPDTIQKCNVHTSNSRCPVLIPRTDQLSRLHSG